MVGRLSPLALPLLALTASLQLIPASAFAPTAAPRALFAARGATVCAGSSQHAILGGCGAALLRANPLQRLGGHRAGARKVRRDGIAGARAMFTGIVEEIGEVEGLSIDMKTPGVTLTLNANTVLEGAYEGCSIAVNGVCLTVTKFDKKQFTVGVAPETLRVTNLGELSVGSPPPGASRIQSI
ncbi:hypothetical protein T484DRAFT_1891825 [Baffinella frigidus]|nr:hypothetical protein T484DRAFT_1891825 [Cryptophyta sp. CCMP2293]